MKKYANKPKKPSVFNVNVRWHNDLPDMLRVDATGRLFCKDGSNVKKYLKSWYDKIKAKHPEINELQVCIVSRVGLETIVRDAELARNWPA